MKSRQNVRNSCHGPAWESRLSDAVAGVDADVRLAIGVLPFFAAAPFWESVV